VVGFVYCSQHGNRRFRRRLVFEAATGAEEGGAEALLEGALGEEFGQVARDVDAAFFEFE